MKTVKYLWLLLILPAAMNSVAGQDATEIIRKSDEKLRGASSYADLTMTIVRPTWTREVSMKSWSLGNEYALIKITAPARDRGTATLKREKEIWN